MTRDEIIEIAKQAGYFLYDLTETHQKKTVETDEADEWAQLERFAKLVAEHEREACANLLMSTDLSGLKSDLWLQQYTAQVLSGYAKAIRARSGEQK